MKPCVSLQQDQLLHHGPSRVTSHTEHDLFVPIPGCYRVTYILTNYSSCFPSGRPSGITRSPKLRASLHTCTYLHQLIRPCHSSGGESPVSHRGGLSSSPGQVVCDLLWTKWYWGRFSSSTYVFLPILIPPTAPHSSSVIRGWYNSPVSGRHSKRTQSQPTPRNRKRKLYYTNWWHAGTEIKMRT
jgi:hypothetical protein